MVVNQQLCRVAALLGAFLRIGALLSETDVAVVGEDAKVPVLVPNALPDDDVRLRDNLGCIGMCA